MKQLQLHEYLRLLDGGTDSHVLEDDRADGWRAQARALWSELRLDRWAARARRISMVYRCRTSGRLLVHVTADWKDCFLILSVPPAADDADAWILFDIGAEYVPTQIDCPALGVRQQANERIIRDCLERLPACDEPFAILDKGRGTYMQCYAGADGFEIEHQLVSTAAHYQLPSGVSVDVAIEILASYECGRFEWARDHSWVQMEL